MSKSYSKFHKITWSERVEARALRALITSGIPVISTKQVLIWDSPWPRGTAAVTINQPTASTRQEIFLTCARLYSGHIMRTPLMDICLALAHYTHESQAAIMQLVNLEPATMKSSDTIPPDIMARLESALAGVENALHANDPLISNHLRASHQILISYPETVHLLEDTEIASLISAAQVHTKIELVKAAAPKTSRAAAKKASLDEF